MSRMPLDGYEAALMVLAGIPPDPSWIKAQEEANGGPVVHLCGATKTLCCGESPFWLPAWHRLTVERELANCGGS